MKTVYLKKAAGLLLTLCLGVQMAAMPTTVSAGTAADSLSLNQHSVSFCVGDSVELSAQVTPENAENKAVHFAATDDSIVLSEPVFHADTGTTTVAVSALENVSGSVIAYSEDGYLTDECTVSVGEVLEDSEMVNRATGGTVTASSENSNAGEDKTKAFDNSASTKWLVLNTSSASITYQFANNERYYITKYAIVSANDDSDRDPKNWVLYGSNDGATWDQLDERTDEIFYGRKLKRIFECSSTSAYSYYKLEITANNGGTHTQLSEIQLFECGDYPSWGMGPFEKQDDSNPILEPNSTDSFYCPVTGSNLLWSDLSLYNPTAIVKDGEINLLYRAQDNTSNKTSRIGLATSSDGLTFDSLDTPVIYPDNTYNEYEWSGGCEDPRVIEGPDGVYYCYYTGYNGSIAKLMVASSTDLVHWQKYGLVFADAYGGKYQNTWSKSGSVITEIVDGKQVAKQLNGKYWMYWGESDFFMAYSDDLIHWTPLEDESGNLVSVMEPRDGMYDSYLVEPGPAAIYTDEGIFMLYNSCNASPTGTGDPMLASRAYCPGQVMFNKDDPTQIINRTSSYFMYPEEDYELDGLVNNVCFVEGMVYYNDIWYIYYGTADSRLAVATWDPTANVSTDEAEVTMTSDTMTLRAGQSGTLSATLKTGITSDKALKFVSTNPEISIGNVAYDSASGQTTVTLSADEACTGTILAINEDSYAAAVTTVTVTKAYSQSDPVFLSGGQTISSVKAGEISAQIDITGYYDTSVGLQPVIAAYEDGKLIDWQAGSLLTAVQEGVTNTIQTPAITIPESDDMTKYAVKVFLWDADKAPQSEAVSLDAWSPPDLALGKTASASSKESDNVTASKAVDGDSATRWASSSQDNQWLMVDLGAVMDVDQVVISWEAAYAKQYRIEVSATGTSSADFTTVATVTNGAGKTETVAFERTRARYVRLYCETRATEYGNSVWTFSVYDTQQKTDYVYADTAQNLAVAAVTLTDTGIIVTADAANKTAAVTLNLPEEAGEQASVICLTPDYLQSSGIDDGSDYLTYADDVGYLNQFGLDENGLLNFSMKLNTVEAGQYLIAVTTAANTYLYTFDFDLGYIPGDVGGDGLVTVADVVDLRGLIIAGSWTQTQGFAGDMDGNGTLTVSDVVELRDYIMKKG